MTLDRTIMASETKPSLKLLDYAEKISQGAEAVRATCISSSDPIQCSKPLPQKIYRAQLHPPPSASSPAPPQPETASERERERERILIKHRFHKQYRHPTLDASLTKARVAGEARALMKCLRYASFG